MLFGHLFFHQLLLNPAFFRRTLSVIAGKCSIGYLPIYSLSKVPFGSRKSWYISPPRLPWPRAAEGSEQGKSAGHPLLAHFLSLLICLASWICRQSSSQWSVKSNRLESFPSPRILPSIPPALFGTYWFSYCQRGGEGRRREKPGTYRRFSFQKVHCFRTRDWWLVVGGD